jgi:hypothetical protein
MGKLFERENGSGPVCFDKRERQRNLRHSTLTATKKLKPAAHATEATGSGTTAAQGWVLLLLFLPIKKSKKEKAY